MAEIKLSELAERSGVPGRTIRLYISRGLLPPPLRRGRDAAYGREHLDALEKILKLQRRGLTLAEIGRRMAGPEDAAPTVEPTPTLEYRVAEDVAVYVRGDVSGWRMQRIRTAVEQLARSLTEEPENNPEGPRK